MLMIFYSSKGPIGAQKLLPRESIDGWLDSSNRKANGSPPR